MINKCSFILVFLAVIFVNSCVSQPANIENSPIEIEVEATITQSKEISNSTTAPQPAETEKSTLALVTSTSEVQEKNSQFTYFLDQNRVNQFCLELPQVHIQKPLHFGNYYIAYVLEQQNLSSISIQDGTIDPLHVSEFPDGHLDGLVGFEYPWYTYSVTDSPQGFGDWHLHLVNVEDGTNTVIASRDQYGSYSLHNEVSLDQNQLYFVTSTFDGAEILTSRLYSIDLKDKKETLLIDSPDKNTFMSLISASNGYLVIENDIPKSDVGFYLSLYDVNNKSFIDLPQSYPASMPDMEYPYVVWKNNPRFQSPTSLTIYNVETGESIIQNIVSRDSFDPTISDGYVITEASTGKDQSRNSVVMYSLENGDIYAIQIGINEVTTNGAYIDNGNVIWAFTTTANADNYSSYICNLPLENVLSDSVEGIEGSQ